MACGSPPGPRGWAPAEPVSIDGQELVLAPHRDKLYAFEEEALNPMWQFPPEQKNQFGLSEASRTELTGRVNNLEIADAQKTQIREAIGQVRVGGDSRDALIELVQTVAPDTDERDSLTERIDDLASRERRALDKIRALYGNIAISEDGTTAFVPSYGGWVFALDTQTGSARWVRDLGDAIVGGAAVDGDVVYVGTHGERLYALDATSGEERWEFKTDGEVWAAPTIAGGAIFATSLGGSLYRINFDGEQEWRFDDAGSGIAARPVVVDGVVYVGAFDNRMYALDAESGDLVWDRLEADNWFWGEPAVADGTLYAASLDGNVYAVDAATGEDRWPEPFDAGAPVRGGIVFTDEGLLVGSRDGFVHKVSAEDGTGINSQQVGTTLEATLTMAEDGTVFAKPRNRVVYAIEPADLSAVTYRIPD